MASDDSRFILLWLVGSPDIAHHALLAWTHSAITGEAWKTALSVEAFDLQLAKFNVKVGNKVFKDRKLRRIIASEEYKFWKFISGKKYLNENLVEFDTRLLRNFYKNNGYYNVEINSSFAKLRIISKVHN